MTNHQQTILKDGSRTESMLERNLSQNEIQTLAQSCVTQRNSYGFESYFEIDRNKKMIFENFILFLKNQGVQVTIFLPPYHPLSYELMSKMPKYKMLQEVENYLKTFGEKNGVVLKGSYNPKNLSLTAEHFLDCMHFKDTAIKRIFNTLLLNAEK